MSSSFFFQDLTNTDINLVEYCRRLRGGFLQTETKELLCMRKHDI